MTGPELLSLVRPALPGVHLLLGLLLSGWTLLFLFRIVLTWYPQLDLSKGALRLVGCPDFDLVSVVPGGFPHPHLQCAFFRHSGV